VWFPFAQMEPSKFQQLFDQLARTPLSKVLAFVAVCSILRLAMHPVLIRTAAHRRTGFYSIAKTFNEIFDAVVYAGVVVFMLIRPFAVQTFLIPSGSMLDTLQINDFIIANKAIYRYSEPQRGDIIVFKPPVEAVDSDQREIDFIKRLMGAPGDIVIVKDGVVFRNGVKLVEPYLNDENHYIRSDWKLVHYEGSYKPWIGKYIPVFLYDERLGNYNTNTARAYAVGADLRDPNAVNRAQVTNGFKPQDMLTPEEVKLARELAEAPPAKIPAGFYLMMGDNRNGSFDGRAWGLVPRENIVGRSEVIWWPMGRWQKTLPVRVGAEPK
jgi:signal peptidase I